MELTANTPQQLRHTNMAAVLSVMRRAGSFTGTELIAETGLARATVIAVCDDLIAAGWVRELPARRPQSGVQKGRPARVFEFDARAGLVVGLDVGVAKTTAVVADLRGAILGRATEIFGDFTAPAAERLDTMGKAVQSALESAGAGQDAVLVAGVGIAAPVDDDGGIPRSQAFWENFDIGVSEYLQERYGWTVLLGNDANLAAMAEHWMGTGEGVGDLAVMLAGERIGFGLMSSGELLHGATGRAGEVGALELVSGVGSPDGIAALVRTLATEAVATGPRATRPGAAARSLLAEFARKDKGGVSAEQVFEAAARGDKTAVSVLDAVARRMGRVIALLATFLDPELVVIGGAVAASSAVLLPPLREELASFMSAPPRVEVSPLGDAIVTLGAVRLALNHVEDRALELVPRAAGLRRGRK
ncbi:putative NBD/HSP70 family sugar kinase [Arthrobacter silviterrae]|uniref:ROK family protein n=1 Tax=Arthrobacter silviterrae TaxID=2026658 RepID=UPI001F0D2F93|nr:ROK family protein [Arthrobacter silviterrae]MDQ0279393.1 putative NBD/HSP70 family sugar kinase [Arthrobacter silviterrae]